MSILPQAHSHSESPRLALWLMIPVKPFDEGKSRLAPALLPPVRAELSQQWLTHVLETATAWGRFAGIAVISRDEAVLALASALGAQPINEPSRDAAIAAAGQTERELNAALMHACAVAQTWGAESILVLPADLPLLCIGDLDALYALANEREANEREASAPRIVIAPSHDGGTNALLLHPANAIPFAFGEESFARHIALAEAAGIPHAVYQSPTLALDIDHPEDLRLAKGSPCSLTS